MVRLATTNKKPSHNIEVNLELKVTFFLPPVGPTCLVEALKSESSCLMGTRDFLLQRDATARWKLDPLLASELEESEEKLEEEEEEESWPLLAEDFFRADLGAFS